MTPRSNASALAIAVVLAIAIGGSAGFGAALGIRDAQEANAYERGLQQGRSECDEPSRLERAARWVAR